MYAMRCFHFRINHFGLCQALLLLQQGRMGQTVGLATTDGKKGISSNKKKKDLEHDQLLRERDEQIIWRGWVSRTKLNLAFKR